MYMLRIKDYYDKNVSLGNLIFAPNPNIYTTTEATVDPPQCHERSSAILLVKPT